jgi:hypothetical protein
MKVRSSLATNQKVACSNHAGRTTNLQGISCLARDCRSQRQSDPFQCSPGDRWQYPRRAQAVLLREYREIHPRLATSSPSVICSKMRKTMSGKPARRRRTPSRSLMDWVTVAAKTSRPGSMVRILRPCSLPKVALPPRRSMQGRANCKTTSWHRQTIGIEQSSTRRP